MPVDHKALREGDAITIRARYNGPVIGPSGLVSVHVAASGPHTVPYELTIRPGAIATHEPRPLEVGDPCVSTHHRNVDFTIIALDGAWAWVKDSNGWNVVVPFDSLSRPESAL